jgi:GGDEF domain-containing protein
MPASLTDFLKPVVFISFSITARLGISLYPQAGAEFRSLVKHAEAAIYRARSRGRNAFLFFNDAGAGCLTNSRASDFGKGI